VKLFEKMIKFLSLIVIAQTFALPEIMTFSEWHGVFGENANHHSKSKTLENREKAFIGNIEKIKAHNSKNLSWRMGVNRFSDLTADEFSKLMRFATCQKHMNETLKLREKRYQRKLQQVRNPKNAASVDWRNSNNPLGKPAVTPVKNQGGCGSCWSFSSSGAVEGAWVVGGNSLVSLSEQELVSCDEQDSACNGGIMDYAFLYVKEYGLTSEENYPYVSGNGQVPPCDNSKASQQVASISNYVDVQTRSEDALENALNIGPVAIAIEADQYTFQSYKSGVMTGTCGDSLDHGVLAVGYGHDTDSNLDYWIVKNSWGPSWGLSGYIYLQRHISSSSGQCGILLQPSYPVAGNVTPSPGPSPSSDYYEDPGRHGEKGCNPEEFEEFLYGEDTRRICIPKCKKDSYCPVTPAGWNAASCILLQDILVKVCVVECSEMVPCPGGTVCTQYEVNPPYCMYQ